MKDCPKEKACVATFYINSTSFKNNSFVKITCAASVDSECTSKQLRFNLVGKYEGNFFFFFGGGG